MEASIANSQDGAATEPSRAAASVETELRRSARTVVGTVQEDAGFIERDGGDLFTVLHRPTEQPPIGSLTVCSSLFAEQHRDYRREVLLARMLASAGVAVARFHYRGVGNSAMAPASLDAFTRDALDVTLALRGSASVSRTAFLGIGVGALVAARALEAYPEAPLALWKPVLDGARFFRDFFRARLVAATRLGGTTRATTDELLARLSNDGQVDVMGFTVSAKLYESLTASGLTELLPRDARNVLVQPFRGSRAAGAERLAAECRARGCPVDFQPIKLPEDPWFIPDGAEVAAAVMALEEELMTTTRDWLLRLWGAGE